MAFIANQKQSANKDIVSNDGYFPDIDLELMRAKVRIDGTVTDERLQEAAIAAVIHVNDQLAAFRMQNEVAGFATFNAIPASQVNGSSVLVQLYLRAVYCMAKADLIERYTDYDTAASSFDDKRLVGFLALSPDNERRNAAWAISDIQGKPHNTVELI